MLVTETSLGVGRMTGPVMLISINNYHHHEQILRGINTHHIFNVSYDGSSLDCLSASDP